MWKAQDNSTPAATCWKFFQAFIQVGSNLREFQTDNEKIGQVERAAMWTNCDSGLALNTRIVRYLHAKQRKLLLALLFSLVMTLPRLLLKSLGGCRPPGKLSIFAKPWDGNSLLLANMTSSCNIIQYCIIRCADTVYIYIYPLIASSELIRLSAPWTTRVKFLTLKYFLPSSFFSFKKKTQLHCR